MRVTYVVNRLDEMGGTERAVLNQAAYLIREHDVTIISVFRTRDKGHFAIDDRISVRYLVDGRNGVAKPVRGSDLGADELDALVSMDGEEIERRHNSLWNRLADLELEMALRTLETDVVISVSPEMMAAVVDLAPLDVMTVHQEHRSTHLRGTTGEPLFPNAAKLDALVSLLPRHRDWIRETFGDAAPRIEVIGNSVAPASFRPKSSRRNKVVTIAGRVTAEKRIDHAIQAWSKVVTVHPDWKLRVLGDGPILNRMRWLAGDLGVDDSVEFLGAVGDVAGEWAKCSIGLLTSMHEGFPLVLIEAFAAGVPVVSYDIETGPAEIVTDEVTGLLVGDGDIDSLADALIRLIGDEAMRDRLGDNALAESAKYDYETVGREWDVLLKDLLAHKDDPDRNRRRADRFGSLVARTGGKGLAASAPLPIQPVMAVNAQKLEREIAAADPTLVRSGGWLCTVDDTLLPADVAARSLDLVTDLLDEHGIDYWYVRGTETPYRIATHESSRPVVLKAMADAWADQPIYAEISTTSGKPSGTSLAAAVIASPHRQTLGRLRVVRPVVTSSRSLRYGPSHGCSIEFWTEDLDTGSMVSTTRTILGATVPVSALKHRSSALVGERLVPTLEAFTKTVVSEVTFPIDVVYTWVDGGDPRWLKRQNAALVAADRPPRAEAAVSNRFASHDELRYSLRSIDAYAPWVRKVWIVTDAQVPEWLDTSNPKVEIVDHRDVFTDPSVLPNYNSLAINGNLHHIPGLAEHFLVMNDDVFLGRPVQASQFFASNGVARHFLSPSTVPMCDADDGDETHYAVAKNVRRLVESAYGHSLTQTFLHAPHPSRVSVLNECEQMFNESFQATMRSRWRSNDDVSLISLGHYVGYFTGRSMPGTLRVGFFDLGNPDHHSRLRLALAKRHLDALCMNDSPVYELPPETRAHLTKAFLELYFPVASQFEIRT